MNLFRKIENNQNEEIENLELKKQINRLCETISKQNTHKDNFTYDLLCEKSTLEKNLVREQTKNEILEKKLISLKEDFSNINTKHNNEILKLQKELAAYKTRLKMAANSNGGLKRKTNRQTIMLERQDTYLKLLKKELKASGRRVPTLKELLTYEHTRRSPYKTMKEGK